MFTYIWEYDVIESACSTFEEAYGPEGAWVRLFRNHPGYLKTELFRDELQPYRHVTIDYWTSREAWTAFRSASDSEFREIDRQCDALTRRESCLGHFVALTGMKKE